MKKILFFVFLFLTFPTVAFAHGEFEKNAGNVIVYINQIPIAPLIGEKVRFSFSFRDKNVKVDRDLSVQNLVNVPIRLNVIDTFYGDESRDKTIYQKKFITDANGNFDFEYTFNKENYFDIELSFLDHDGKPQSTGFLVQPREPKSKGSIFDYLPFLITGILIGKLIEIKFKK